MGLIEAVRKRKSLGVAVAAVLFALAITVGLSARSNRIPPNLTKAFYSADDGKTFFADDINKPYPFDYEGQPAFRAYVYKGANGVPFVAYLERYTKRGLARKLELAANPVDDGGAMAAELLRTETEVRKPGAARWVAVSDPAHAPVVEPPNPTAREMYP